MKVIKGKVKKPIAMILYGVHGIGKSTFATECENPIFIGSEENDELDADRYPKIKTWAELLEQLEWVKKSDYKTVVIDTMDELETIAQKEILKTQGDKTMGNAHGGYGKGYEIMEKMFLVVRDTLASLRDDKGMNIVILCHHEKNKHEDPITLTSYDNYSTALHKKIKPLFEDWVSIIAFANDKLMKTETADGKETILGDGDKVMYFQSRPSHVVKNRFDLPEEIEFNKHGTWRIIKEHVDEFFKKKPVIKEGDLVKKNDDGEIEKVVTLDHDLISEIKEIISKIKNEDIKPKIEVSLSRAKSNDELKRILEKAKSLI